MDKEVLVVEDNDTLRAIIVMQLERLGFTATAAADGVSAVNMVIQGQFKLVLMDIQMPVMDGMEATREIRRDEIRQSKPRVPIVAVTANPNRERCFQAGMDDFLFKPVLLNNIKTILDRWVEAAA